MRTVGATHLCLGPADEPGEGRERERERSAARLPDETFPQSLLRNVFYLRAEEKKNY